MLCPGCRRQVSRSDVVCARCGRPLRGGAGAFDLVLPDGRHVPLAAALTIGRGANNALRLEDETVSRSHARIVVDADGPAVEDSGSSHGTFVGGQRVTDRRRLRDGDTIRLGEAELHIEARRDEFASGKTIVLGAPSGAVAGAAARPRVRTGTRFKRLEASEGDLRFVLQGPDGRFVRMSAAEAELIDLLDGESSYERLASAAEGRLGAGGPARLAALLADLGERGLLEGVASPAAPPSRGRLARLVRPRELTLGWMGPLFESLYRCGGFLLFTGVARAVIVAVCLAGAVSFVDLFAGGKATPFVVASRITLGGLVFLLGRFLVVIAHELAHGLTVASFGRRVPRAGLKLILVFPYAFVDTSEAWFEPTRRRIAISAAGPVSDLTVGGAAGIAALTAGAGTLREVLFQLSLAAYTAAIFNLNPLLDRDGYHIVVDLLHEPGLRRRSREWLANRLSGRPAPDETGVLRTYAIAALVWSAATAAFTIILTLRSYGRLTAIAPVGVVWAVLGLFYLLMAIPIVGVFWQGLSVRRGDVRVVERAAG
jgi:putative peptide zinc metalloprotease protein